MAQQYLGCPVGSHGSADVTYRLRHKCVGLSARGHGLIADLNRRSAATLTTLLQRVPQAKREALEVALLDVVGEVSG